MKLAILSESVFDHFGPDGFAAITSDPQDDTNCLVAYRLRMGGKASNVWIVSLNGQYLGSVSSRNSKWVHDNWEVSFATRYSKDIIERDPGFKQIMTAENRQYLTDMLKRLTNEIKRAKSGRSAEVVLLPIDPEKL